MEGRVTPVVVAHVQVSVVVKYTRRFISLFSYTHVYVQ